MQHTQEDILHDSCSLHEIQDPVWQQIVLNGWTKHFTSHPIFNRLHEIKQTGLGYLVYPGATHTRWNHSVGVAFLANDLTNTIRKNWNSWEWHGEQPEPMSDIDQKCIVLAGLLHDVGHPAFSHFFEDLMNKLQEDRFEATGEKFPRFSHETASSLLCDVLFEDLSGILRREGFSKKDMIFVKELIDPPKKQLIELVESEKLTAEKWDDLLKGRGIGKAWMYEIVSNWRCGFDVDRFDYLIRDAYFCGLPDQGSQSKDRWFGQLRLVEDPRFPSNKSRKLKSCTSLLDSRSFPDSLGAEDGAEDSAIVQMKAKKPTNEGSKPVLWTLGFEAKDYDNLRRNFYEQRKDMHRKMYQHRVGKKFQDVHLLNFLKEIVPYVRVQNSKNEWVGLLMAANVDKQKFDHIAYCKLTDSFIYSCLNTPEMMFMPLLLEANKTVGQRKYREGLQICKKHRVSIQGRKLAQDIEQFEISWKDLKDPTEKAPDKKYIKTLAKPALKEMFPHLVDSQLDEIFAGVYVAEATAHQGAKLEDPMSNIVFYERKWNYTTKLGSSYTRWAESPEMGELFDSLKDERSQSKLKKMQEHHNFRRGFSFSTTVFYVFWMPPESCNFSEAQEKEVRHLLRGVIRGHENMKPRAPVSEDQALMFRNTQSSPRALLRTMSVVSTSAGVKKRGRDGDEELRDVLRRKSDATDDDIEEFQ